MVPDGGATTATATARAVLRGARGIAAPSSSVAVDAAPNGGISVTAGDDGAVRLQVKVMAWPAATTRAADGVAGPSAPARSPPPGRTPDREWWTVSYRLTVPARTDLDLRSHNGGITLTGVRGRTEFTTTNGGVTVDDGGGSIHGRTTNGGVKVALTGSQWDGDGLDVTTTNGGVVLEVPSDYNAHLETGTVNGGVRMDFPVRVQGSLGPRAFDRPRLGGPTIRARTTNGGVVVKRR